MNRLTRDLVHAKGGWLRPAILGGVLLFAVWLGGALLWCGQSWVHTPHGRLDYGAALVARLITAETLTAFSNVMIDRFVKAVEEPAVLPANTPEALELLRRDMQVAIPEGEVKVRIYSPQTTARLFPGMLWVHGGGWVTGQRYVSDDQVIRLASELGIVVVSVDYRLLPEHPFPAALDDCYEILQWMAKESGQLGIDPQRLIVRGESAGANIAAGVVLRARDQNGPNIALQILHQPLVDLRSAAGWESQRKFAKGYFLEMPWIRKKIALYLAGSDESSPYASPLLADLHNLPPALVSVAEFDPLRDEGAAYAEALRADDIEVAFYEAKGALHSLIGSAQQQRRLYSAEKTFLRKRVFLEVSEAT